MGSIIKNLSPMDVRLLVHAEEELSQTGGFQRIWPSSSCHHYHMYSLHLFGHTVGVSQVPGGRGRLAGLGMIAALCNEGWQLR